MFCPFCQAEDTKVIDSRLVADGSQIRRRRSCEVCHSRFTTFETADLALPRVIKTNGERQPFNGSKLKKGMLRALEKRPLSTEEIDTVFGKILKEIRTRDTKQAPGLDIHEMGGVRMGNDPKTSLLNKWNQMHHCKNVFVTDGSCMTSTATQNPSLTFMAISARAANHAIKLLKTKEI